MFVLCVCITRVSYVLYCTHSYAYVEYLNLLAFLCSHTTQTACATANYDPATRSSEPYSKKQRAIRLVSCTHIGGIQLQVIPWEKS